MVAWNYLLQESAHDRDRGGHASGEANSADAILQLGDLILQDLDRRVGSARVGESLGQVLVNGVLHVRGRLDDGRQDGAGPEVRYKIELSGICPMNSLKRANTTAPYAITRAAARRLWKID